MRTAVPFLALDRVLAVSSTRCATGAEWRRGQPDDRGAAQPDRVFDGETMHTGWTVMVRGDRIEAAGPALAPPAGAEAIALPGTTLLPGLIEGHSHLLLHPYNETPWNDQVVREPLALSRGAGRQSRARDTLMAGVTTVRDLGTEGAGYADVGLKRAIDEGVDPRSANARRRTGHGGAGQLRAEGIRARVDRCRRGRRRRADSTGSMRVARDQIGRGADFIKVYADYRYGPNGEARPTFTLDELRRIVDVARQQRSSGRRACFDAGRDAPRHRGRHRNDRTRRWRHRRDLEADGRAKVGFCPTLAAGDAIAQYGGWKKGVRPRAGAHYGQARQLQGGARRRRHDVLWRRCRRLRARRQRARARAHGRVRHGRPLEALRSATSVNARLFHLEATCRRRAPGLLADLVAVEGDPIGGHQRLAAGDAGDERRNSSSAATRMTLRKRGG